MVLVLVVGWWGVRVDDPLGPAVLLAAAALLAAHVAALLASYGPARLPVDRGSPCCGCAADCWRALVVPVAWAAVLGLDAAPEQPALWTVALVTVAVAGRRRGAGPARGHRGLGHGAGWWRRPGRGGLHGPGAMGATMGAMMYRALHTVVPPLAKAVWRPTVTGLEHVPRSGAVILASNHLSFVDSVVIPVVAPRKVVFLAKSDYFTGTGVRGALQRAWFEGLGMLPVDRDDTKAAIASLDTALEVLGRGEAFGIYPEGTRSRDGRLYRGRTGVAHLALTAGCPVVPVGLHRHPGHPAGRLHAAAAGVGDRPLRTADRGRGRVRRRALRARPARAHRPGHGRDRGAVRPGGGRGLQRALLGRVTPAPPRVSVPSGWVVP